MTATTNVKVVIVNVHGVAKAFSLGPKDSLVGKYTALATFDVSVGPEGEYPSQKAAEIALQDKYLQDHPHPWRLS